MGINNIMHNIIIWIINWKLVIMRLTVSLMD
jgi:hypothetical protein